MLQSKHEHKSPLKLELSHWHLLFPIHEPRSLQLKSQVGAGNISSHVSYKLKLPNHAFVVIGVEYSGVPPPKNVLNSIPLICNPLSILNSVRLNAILCCPLCHTSITPLRLARYHYDNTIDTKYEYIP